MSAPVRFSAYDAEIVRYLVKIGDIWITREDTLVLWRKLRPDILSLADRIEKSAPPARDTGDKT